MYAICVLTRRVSLRPIPQWAALQGCTAVALMAEHDDARKNDNNRAGSVHGVRNLRQCETAVANRFFFSIPFEATLFAHQNEFGFQIRIEDVLGALAPKCTQLLFDLLQYRSLNAG